MGMSDEQWQPEDDSTTDPDVEWAFFGAHAIEYWVVRDGRLVPADGSELEHIAERERERAAEVRLLRWERGQRQTRQPGVVVRVVSWCRGVLWRGPESVHRAGPKMVEGRSGTAPRQRPTLPTGTRSGAPRDA